MEVFWLLVAAVSAGAGLALYVIGLLAVVGAL
jgi:hypothetical protein